MCLEGAGQVRGRGGDSSGIGRVPAMGATLDGWSAFFPLC